MKKNGMQMTGSKKKICSMWNPPLVLKVLYYSMNITLFGQSLNIKYLGRLKMDIQRREKRDAEHIHHVSFRADHFTTPPDQFTKDNKWITVSRCQTYARKDPKWFQRSKWSMICWYKKLELLVWNPWATWKSVDLLQNSYVSLCFQDVMMAFR